MGSRDDAAARSSASCSRRCSSHSGSRGTSRPTRRSAPRPAATWRLRRPARVRSFSYLLFRLPDVPNPRHRLTEAVDELICLEVLNAAEHDDLGVDAVFLQFRDSLLGRTNGLNLIVA